MKTPPPRQASATPAKHVQEAAEIMNKPRLHRLNLDIPAEVHAKLKAKAAIDERSIREVILSFIEEYIK